ncbi:hypothetical protein ZIOFF_028130 [Zingiber officinale]|uniref:Gamma-soluble NSF attachment protein n=1 Tax=Zingiber officinale TaxID=94328 RepID=A0A8J5GKV8_ZINOF|nr:hypothetical protein ZIOFF_028130 [Zingiber officinale]
MQLPQMFYSAPWDAAKHMESAASLAKELSRWNEVSDFYRKASELFRKCGRSQPASDALGKGARKVGKSKWLLIYIVLTQALMLNLKGEELYIIHPAMVYTIPYLILEVPFGNRLCGEEGGKMPGFLDMVCKPPGLEDCV